MAPHTTSSFDSVLRDVQAARAWLDKIGVHTAGTRLEMIETTLQTFLHDLNTLSAAEVVARWDWTTRQDVYYAFTEGEGFGRIHDQLGPLRSHQLPREELKRALRGPLVPAAETPENTDPRNIFMELDLAATLMRAGVEVTDFDDVQFNFDSIHYITQCKRPFSARSVATNVDSAWGQIVARAPKGSYSRGIIALAVDKVLELDQQRPPGIHDGPELDALVQKLAQDFVANHRAAWHAVMDSRGVGILLVFRFVCHTLPPANTISAVNYQVLVPTARPGTRDDKRLRQLATQLAR